MAGKLPLGLIAGAFVPQSNSYSTFSPYVTGNITAFHPSVGLWQFTCADLVNASIDQADLLFTITPLAAPDGGVGYGLSQGSVGVYNVRTFVSGVLADVAMSFEIRFRR